MIENFKDSRVLVVGDVMLDRYWWGSVSRISPEAPVPVINLQRTSSMPGGAANVALNVASLGASVRLISCIGDDKEGAELSEALLTRGVEAGGLLRVSERRTSVKTRIIAHSQQVTRVDSEQVDDLSAVHADKLAETIIDAITDAEAIIVSDYAKGTLTESVLAAALGASKPVLVDPKGKDYRKYAGASVLTPNRREAAEACKFEESEPNVVRKAGERLLDDLGLRHVLITEGENGMTLFTQGESPFHLDASMHQVYDVTGAGDSVIACLGVAMAAGLPIREACQVANAAGGLSVQHIGTHAVKFEELEIELERTTR